MNIKTIETVGAMEITHTRSYQRVRPLLQMIHGVTEYETVPSHYGVRVRGSEEMPQKFFTYDEAKAAAEAQDHHLRTYAD